MQKILLVLSLVFAVITANVKAQSITGDTEVDPGDTSVYINTLYPCGAGCAEYYWHCEGGNIIGTPSESQVSVSWGQEAYFYVELWMLDSTDEEEMVDFLKIKVGNPREIQFTYDQSGNRTQTETIYLSSGGTKSLGKTPEKEEEPEFSKELKVYPNPFKEFVYLTLDDEAYEATQRTVILYDNLGRLIREYQVYDYVNELEMSGLKSGSYILKLLYDGSQKQWIIIKN